MSSDPTQQPKPRFWRHMLTALNVPPVRMALVAIVTATLTALATYFGIEPKVVERVVEVLVPIAQEPTEYTPTQGWVPPDEATVAANLDPARTTQFAATPAGRAVMGDGDALLWRSVRKHGKYAGNAYPNVNQRSVGCCVGCGWKHCADVALACAIANGAQFEFKLASAEAIYAGSRVEVGGGRINGDGSIGAWAKEWSQDKGGMIPMEQLGRHDLRVFDPARARAWGRTGVPDELEPDARKYPIKGCALVRSWAEAKKALQQGYPVAVCSNQGFTMQRDATGRCRPQGVWNHCMALVAVRTGANEGGFLLNSWGDNAHTGPVWPEDAPVAGFWADAAVLDRMLRQNDSFALADVQGFPARNPSPDWFIRARPVRPHVDLFARGEFALSY